LATLPDPSPAMAAQRPPLLRGGFLVVPPSRAARVTPPRRHAGAQGVAVIAAIRTPAPRSLAGPSRFAGVADRDRVEGLLTEGDFRRGRRLQGLLPTEDPRHRPQPSPWSPCHVSCSRRWAPVVGGDEAAIDTAVIPAARMWVVEWGQERPPALEQEAPLLPRLEPPPAGARTASPAGQRAPLAAGPQDPPETRKAAPISHTWAPPAGGSLGGRKMAAHGFPWWLGQLSPRPGLPSRLAWQHLVFSDSDQ